MERNKIIYGGQTLIDLTDATATASDILSGKTAYGADGSLLVGTNTNSEWTSGIYMDEDGYIRVSPLAGAGGVYYDGGYIYFGEEPSSALPNGDYISYGQVLPHLISLNGHWDFENNGTIDVTEGNHFVAVSNNDYGIGGIKTITRSDGKPWFGLWNGLLEVKITGDLKANGGFELFTSNEPIQSVNDAFFNVTKSNGVSSRNININPVTPVEIYGIGVKHYWKGVTDIYVEIYLEGQRIV